MALGDARKNFATSTVATAPSPATSGTSLVVASGEGSRFPAASFNAVICPSGAAATPANAEVVRVTNISTDTFTITRAQEGSSSRTVIVGDRIYQSLTAVDYPAPSASITTIEPDDAAAAGTAETYARGDHKHALVAAAPTALQSFTSAVAEGTSTSFARADHDHGLPWTSAIWAVAGYQFSGALASTATGGVNTYYNVPMVVLGPQTITGVEIRNGATQSGNLRAALYNVLGTRVADRTSDLAQAGSVNTNRRVPFDSPYSAVPGLYQILIWFSSATATAFMGPVHGARAGTGTNATTTPTSPGTLAVNTTAPVMSLY